ncbi:MAG: NADH-quinone oxidoreductase subunit J [Pirellulales bacterium]|nr:NADH-quinone oxidoreductase subunit J [Pirellulales bacterium]
MSLSQFYLGLAAMIFAAGGMWLLLPRGRKGGRWLGGLLAAVALVCFGLLGQSLGSVSTDVVYFTTAAVAVVAAVLAVSFRSPIYCAIWFALSLLATAGLFMLQGAQFLAVASVVVYAGAILVTFLFVLMLAQPEGHAYYDRVSWEGFFAALTGAVLVGTLTVLIVRVWHPPRDERIMAALAGANSPLKPDQIQRARVIPVDSATAKIELELTPDTKITDPLLVELQNLFTQNAQLKLVATKFSVTALTHTPPPTPRHVSPETPRAADILHPQHVARLGGEMFSRHLIAVEVAGTLLLVALVGAIAILARERRDYTVAAPQDIVPLGQGPRTPPDTPTPQYPVTLASSPTMLPVTPGSVSPSSAAPGAKPAGGTVASSTKTSAPGLGGTRHE